MNETAVNNRNNREIVMPKAKSSLTAYMSMGVYLLSTVDLTFKERYTSLRVCVGVSLTYRYCAYTVSGQDGGAVPYTIFRRKLPNWGKNSDFRLRFGIDHYWAVACCQHFDGGV